MPSGVESRRVFESEPCTRSLHELNMYYCGLDEHWNYGIIKIRRLILCVVLQTYANPGLSPTRMYRKENTSRADVGVVRGIFNFVVLPYTKSVRFLRTTHTFSRGTLAVDFRRLCTENVIILRR